MRALRFVAIVCSALVLGLTLSHVLQAPGSRGLGLSAWLTVQHTFYGGFAVVGGLSELIGLLATTISAYLLRQRVGAAAGPLVAAVCLLGTLLAYWFGNRPVNARVSRWTPTAAPSDWSTYRDHWETAHAISATLAAVALISLLVSTIWQPTGRDGSARRSSGRAVQGSAANAVRSPRSTNG